MSKQILKALLMTSNIERKYDNYVAWVKRCWNLPNIELQVTSGPQDHLVNFYGDYEAWGRHLIDTYDVILIPYRRVGKVTGEVAINALVKNKLVYAVMYPEGLVEVSHVMVNDPSDYKSGWEIVPKAAGVPTSR